KALSNQLGGLRGIRRLRRTVGPLHGFPYAVKDLQPVRGIKAMFGSPILKDFVPTTDGIMVERRSGVLWNQSPEWLEDSKSLYEDACGFVLLRSFCVGWEIGA